MVSCFRISAMEKMNPVSPFITHRSMVLGHYSTAKWLRGVVLALWNGRADPVGLSQLTNTDSDHFSAFISMVEHYRRFGENDPALHDLVHEIQKRQTEERAAQERAKNLEEWNYEARQQLRAMGQSADAVEDRYGWFESRFDAGRTAFEAAEEFAAIK